MGAGGQVLRQLAARAPGPIVRSQSGHAWQQVPEGDGAQISTAVIADDALNAPASVEAVRAASGLGLGTNGKKFASAGLLVPQMVAWRLSKPQGTGQRRRHRNYFSGKLCAVSVTLTD